MDAQRNEVGVVLGKDAVGRVDSNRSLQSVDGRLDFASLGMDSSLPVGKTIVLRRAATVEGILYDADGKPKDGGRVGFVAGPCEARLDNDHYLLTGEDGVFRFAEIDPETVAWLTATLWSSDYGGRVEPVPLEGRLKPGETLRIDLRLPPSTSCLIEFEFADWRPGLSICNDSSISPFDLKSVWTTREHTGYHRFTIRDEKDENWKHRFEIRVPHGEERYRQVVPIPAR